MVFVGVFMMPFYYGSRARSVPEYLRLRFDEKTRGLNAISLRDHDGFFLRHLDVRDGEADSDAAHSRHAAAEIGVPQYWSFHLSILIAALIVLAYVLLGGLTSAIYNEVLQFFLIVAGFLPLGAARAEERRRLDGPEGAIAVGMSRTRGKEWAARIRIRWASSGSAW